MESSATVNGAIVVWFGVLLIRAYCPKRVCHYLDGARRVWGLVLLMSCAAVLLEGFQFSNGAADLRPFLQQSFVLAISALGVDNVHKRGQQERESEPAARPHAAPRNAAEASQSHAEMVREAA
jgi:hypothetical protein